MIDWGRILPLVFVALLVLAILIVWWRRDIVLRRQLVDAEVRMLHAEARAVTIALAPLVPHAITLPELRVGRWHEVRFHVRVNDDGSHEVAQVWVAEVPPASMTGVPRARVFPDGTVRMERGL